MRTVLKGQVEALTPQLQGSITAAGVLALGAEGELDLTLDTGFNGGIALPEDRLASLDVEPLGFESFVLATGEYIELPTFRGRVILPKRHVVVAQFIPGDYLIGTEFMATIASRLVVDFERERVVLQKR